MPYNCLMNAENANSELPPLTEKELRFCREYAASPNGTQAYLRAFGKKVTYGSANELARRLLQKVAVKAEIAAARKEYLKQVRLDATRVLQGLIEIAFFDPDDCFESDESNGGLPRPRPWEEITAATRRAIKSVKVKRRKLKGDKDDTVSVEIEEIEYKFHDKLAALDKLCKHLGLTKEGAGIESLVEFMRQNQKVEY